MLLEDLQIRTNLRSFSMSVALPMMSSLHFWHMRGSNLDLKSEIIVIKSQRLWLLFLQPSQMRCLFSFDSGKFAAVESFLQGKHTKHSEKKTTSQTLVLIMKIFVSTFFSSEFMPAMDQLSVTTHGIAAETDYSRHTNITSIGLPSVLVVLYFVFKI